MPTRDQFKRVPIVPFDPTKGGGVAGALDQLRRCSFQGRQLGDAFGVWQNALKDNATIFLGLAGAMTPAGMRRTLMFLIEKRLIDVLVSTGANLFHDTVEALGHQHYKCHPATDDKLLRKHRLDRIYDTVGDDKVYFEMDEFIADFARSLEGRPYTTREFFHEMGRHLAEVEKSPGILSTAFRAGVPVYCPAIADSSWGLALAGHLAREHGLMFDVVEDVRETGLICVKAKTTGVVFLGGGTPKNFTQQAWVIAEKMSDEKEISDGHKYCVQFSQDAPHWGGLSGCTFDESISWGKIDWEAEKVNCYVDATIALPIVAQGLAEREAWKLRRKVPRFRMERTFDFGMRAV